VVWIIDRPVVMASPPLTLGGEPARGRIAVA
jgi:hypothetical protein